MTTTGYSKLRTILLTGYLATIAAALAVILYLYIIQDTLAREEWPGVQQPLATALAEQIGNELRSVQHDLELLASLPVFTSPLLSDQIDRSVNGIPRYLEPTKRRLLDRVMDENPRLSVIFQLLPDGGHYLSHPFRVQQSLKRYNLRHRPYFQQVKESLKTVISDSFVGADGRLAVVIDTPVLNRRGELTSHLGGVFHLASLNGYLEQSDIGDFDQAFIVDGGGQLIAHSDSRWLDKNLRGRFADRALTRKLLQLPSQQLNSGELLKDSDSGHEYMGFKLPLGGNWQLILLGDWRRIREVARDRIYPLPLISAGILIVPLLIGLVVIGRLGRRWESAERKVVEARNQLEQRVRARTRELEQSHTHIERLLAFSKEGMFGLDRRGYCTFVNQACLDLLGYRDRSQLIGSNMHELIHHSLKDGAPNHHRRCRIFNSLRSGESVHADDEVFWRADGRFFSVEYRCSPILEQGAVVGAVVSFNDISARKTTERALIESNRRFHQLADYTDDVFWVGDVTERYRPIYVNPAFQRIWQRSAEELYQDPGIWYSCIHPEDRERAMREFDQLIDGQGSRDLRFRIVRPDRSIRDIWIRGHSVRDDEGALISIAGIAQDITELNSAQQQLRLLSMAVEQSPVSVLITDADARIQYVNRAFERISGYSAAELMDRNPRVLKSEYTPSSRYQQLWQTLMAGEPWHGELRNRKKSGELYWEQVHISPVEDEDGQVRHYLGIKEDITLQKVQEERILYQSHYDELTGLPNRFLSLDLLAESLNTARSGGHQVAVLFLDLDDFKKVNDTLGHETGDRLLIEASRRLSSLVEEREVVGRLGGDEFILLLSGLTGIRRVSDTADRILAAFRQPFVIDGRELRMTVSIGVALYPDDGVDAPELLRHADTAMFCSKEVGRNNCHFFTDTMNEQVTRRLALEEQLQTALSREELFVLYQPIVELSECRLVGVEALLRWRNPVLGEVSPEEFIDVAEHSGLILPVGDFVLEQALSLLSDLNPPAGFTVSVNVSPRQFRDRGLARRIQDMLLMHGLSGSSLKLEITEGVLLSSQSGSTDILQNLRAMGIGIAMDDFGTGYSSLSYLRTYPFDTLKIDRSFIRDVNVDPADRELVTAALTMAQGLGLKVVAEGVETEQQLEFLRQLDCELGQGWLFGRPMSGQQLRTWMDTQNS